MVYKKEDDVLPSPENPNKTPGMFIHCTGTRTEFEPTRTEFDDTMSKFVITCLCTCLCMFLAFLLGTTAALFFTKAFYFQSTLVKGTNGTNGANGSLEDKQKADEQHVIKKEELNGLDSQKIEELNHSDTKNKTECEGNQCKKNQSLSKFRANVRHYKALVIETLRQTQYVHEQFSHLCFMIISDMVSFSFDIILFLVT
jgi:hypothetical protein